MSLVRPISGLVAALLVLACQGGVAPAPADSELVPTRATAAEPAAAQAAAAEALPEHFRLRTLGSSIHFIGIKNNAVAVPGVFIGLEGSLDRRARTATIEIPLAQLATRDEERDSNLRIHLFAVGANPVARFTVDGVDAAARPPEIGGSVEFLVNGVLDLRGRKIAIDAPVRLTREVGNLIRIRSVAPLVLTSTELGLDAAFAVLKAVCGHEALSGAVPIEVDLLFEPGPVT